MSRSGQRHEDRRQQPRGNGHGPHSDHRDQRCVLGGDRFAARLHQTEIGPCVTGWPVRRPGFPYTGGRTRQRQRCALAMGRQQERSRQLV
jgi:hypothetical protein